MIHEIAAKGLTFSADTPRICCPVSGTSLEEVLWEIRSLEDQPVDLIEWRADYFREDIRSALPKVLEEAGEKPLLFTLRTKQEGGGRAIPEYGELLEEVIRRGTVPMVDIELSAGEPLVQRLTALAKERKILTVLSAHFFAYTPDTETLTGLFDKMKSAGGDIPKIAVMPQNFKDTLRLMGAAYEASRDNRPVIAIAMGALGGMTRLCPGVMGSCLTFSAGKLSSAPGQLRPKLVREALDALQ